MLNFRLNLVSNFAPPNRFFAICANLHFETKIKSGYEIQLWSKFAGKPPKSSVHLFPKKLHLFDRKKSPKFFGLFRFSSFSGREEKYFT